MTREESFAVWAPDGAIWSAWAKPVLFAHMTDDAGSSGFPPAIPEVDWAPLADGRAAIVLDVPGPLGVWLGVALAMRGYRPVPLYNAAPGPPGEIRPGLSTALVEVRPIIEAIGAGAEHLGRLSLLPEAPPAFLLDWNRRTARGTVLPGRFDNRSISFPTDFPGAQFLLSRGIRAVLLVQENGREPQADLAHTLRGWQDAGIAISVKELASDAPPVACIVRRPSFYRRIVYRLMTLSGLRRNPLGGFGGTLPEPSSG